MAPAEWPETPEHGGIRIKALVGPVMPLLELCHCHSFGPKDYVAHVVKVPIVGENPIFFAELFIDAGSGVRRENSKNSGIDFSLLAEIHDLPKN
jgi:hypothetical protein